MAYQQDNHAIGGAGDGARPLPNAHEVVLTCPACGGPRPHAYLYTKNGCEIRRCEGCGLGRAEQSGFDPAAYYTGAYFSGRHSDGYADYLGAEDVLRHEFTRALDFIRTFRSRGRLLEIGCAYGFFLHEAKRHFEVGGIEIAEEAASHCRGGGLNVVTGTASEENLRRFGKQDVIVMLDVIEHLPDPRETLALCMRQLNPGGIIVLTTGDFGSPLARWLGSGWRLMTPPQHLWFFTADSMRKLASGIGGTLEALDHPWKFVPMSLAVFQLQRMLGFAPAVPPAGGRIGLPVNLFDAMRVVVRKTDSGV